MDAKKVLCFSGWGHPLSPSATARFDTKKVLCFSGWGQEFDSLEPIFDAKEFSNLDVTSIDYSKFNGFDEFAKDFTLRNLDADFVIGWSLGGQIALRSIAKNLINPQKLILIAPPFQMVKDERIKAAMGQDTFKEFYENFAKSPNATLKKFSILTSMNDVHASLIAKNLHVSHENYRQWQCWLDELRDTSFFDFDFGNIPLTLFFHGKGDMIVHSLQANYFEERIEKFTLKQYSNCGHAPHLSDVEKFRQDLLEFIY